VNVGPVPGETAPPAQTFRVRGVVVTPLAAIIEPAPPSLKSNDVLVGLAGHSPDETPVPEGVALVTSLPEPMFSSQK
jgi:hypothetical protein